jgi:hypothetical protein
MLVQLQTWYGNQQHQYNYPTHTCQHTQPIENRFMESQLPARNLHQISAFKWKDSTCSKRFYRNLVQLFSQLRQMLVFCGSLQDVATGLIKLGDQPQKHVRVYQTAFRHNANSSFTVPNSFVASAVCRTTSLLNFATLKACHNNCDIRLSVI